MLSSEIGSSQELPLELCTGYIVSLLAASPRWCTHLALTFLASSPTFLSEAKSNSWVLDFCLPMWQTVRQEWRKGFMWPREWGIGNLQLRNCPGTVYHGEKRECLYQDFEAPTFAPLSPQSSSSTYNSKIRLLRISRWSPQEYFSLCNQS